MIAERKEERLVFLSFGLIKEELDMKRIRIKFSLLFVTLLIGVSKFVQAQTMPVFPPENFKLNTDRDLYLTGETLWFSAIDLLANDKELESKVLYIELYDRYGKAHIKQKHDLKAGNCKGSIRVPEELTSDYYFLRIYTALLRNYPEHYFPEKRIIIVNPEIPFLKDKSANDQYKILFPNGGLVDDLLNEGYLWVSNQVIPGKVSIISSNGDTLQTPKEIEKGLFAIQLRSITNQEYEIQLEYEESDFIKLRIPKSGKDYLVKTSVEDEQVLIQIESNNQGFNKFKDRNLRLEIYDENLVLRKNFDTQYTRQTQILSIPGEELSKGIYYLRILDQNGELLAFSLISNADSFQQNAIDITFSKDQYAQDEEVELMIHPNNAGDLLKYDVSVTKKGTSGNNTEFFNDWIVNPGLSDLQLLQILSSECFKAANIVFMDEHKGRILNLLKKNSPIQSMLFVPETRALNISGRVVDEKSGEPMKNASIILSQIDKHTRVHLSQTKSDGSFAFPIYHQYKSKDLFLSTLGQSNSGSLIQINNDFCNEFPKVEIGFPVFDTSDKAILEELWLNQQLTDYTQEILIENITPPKFDSLFGFSNAEIVVKLHDYIDLADMETIFSEIVPFVSTRKRKGEFSLVVYDEITGSKYHDPLVLVDNIPLNNINELMKIKPSEIEEIQVINRIFYLGDYYLRGVVLIKSKAGNFAGIPMPEDAIFLKYQMLQQPTAFIPPVKDKNSFRNVLFWSPDNTSHEKKKFVFNTSQHISCYEVIIRGVLKDGQLFENRKSFSVVKKN